METIGVFVGPDANVELMEAFAKEDSIVAGTRPIAWVGVAPGSEVASMSTTSVVVMVDSSCFIAVVISGCSAAGSIPVK